MLKPLLVAASLIAFVSVSAQAQDTIKIGEINSYKAQPAFLASSAVQETQKSVARPQT